MKNLMTLAGIAVAALLMENVGMRAPVGDRVGKLPDGGFLLNTGWKLHPAGEQVKVDTFPMALAVSHNGNYLLVLNGGYNPPSVSVISIADHKEIGRTPVPDGWLGLALEPNGNRVFVGGGSRGAVYALTLDEAKGKLTQVQEIPAVKSGEPRPFIGDVAVSADAHLLYAADLYNDRLAVINLQSGQVIDYWKTGRRPYRLLLTPGGRRLFVTSWADGTVEQLDASSGTPVNQTRVGPHATDMLLINQSPPSDEKKTDSIARLFVAASNSNNVYSFGVTKEGILTALEAVNTALTPMQPLGMTPSALAADAAGKRLFIACSDANAIAVVDISQPQARVIGYVPTGWYPTAVTTLANGELAIANGKGLGSYPNPNGPVPTEKNKPLYEGGPVVSPGYVAHIQTGTTGFVKIPDDAQLASMTETVHQDSPYRDDLIYAPIADEQTAHFANVSDHRSPIHQVIYIIKENRTYDQVLGDMPQGNGDKNLTLFGEKVTPNLHRLAQDFILFDNFYENSDVSADGHNWAAAAIAPDYTVKTWPNEYGHRRKKYDFEGGEPANSPPAGYVWSNALQAGVTVRSYGEWAENIPLNEVRGEKQIKASRDPALLPYTDLNYRGFDLNYPDVARAKEFIREWREFDRTGRAPQLSIVRMGNDHTSGTAAGALTPLAYNADNDYAVGMLVDAVSHSKLWSSTAIFIIEDDAQNGPDHVDSHRAPAWVISPYTQRGVVDSRMYNQTSVLRSIEYILGLQPLTQFDAAARPMFGSWSREPNLKPYTALPPTTSTTERNPGRGVGARESARMDFSQEDRIDDDELNAILWAAIKHTPMPPPVRSRFSQSGH